MNRRTSLITAAAIGGTLLVGSGAVAANIVVLNAAEDDSIGNLSANTPVAPTPTTVEAQVVDVYIEDPQVSDPALSSATVVQSTDDDAQQFAVEAAGFVTVEQSSTGLVLGDVEANTGWTWTAEQPTGDDVSVTFVSGPTTYRFHARLAADRSIAARVDQRIINVVQTPASSPATTSETSGDRDDDDDSFDDDDDDHDDDEHERGDDDGEDEDGHGGGDDDD